MTVFREHAIMDKPLTQKNLVNLLRRLNWITYNHQSARYDLPQRNGRILALLHMQRGA